MTVVVVVGPGNGGWPDIRGFTRHLVEWNALMGRRSGIRDVRLYVRTFVDRDAFVVVYGNVTFTYVPSEFMGYLCPWPFIPFRYNYQMDNVRRRRPVRIRFFFERPNDWSGWDFFRSPEAVDLWRYGRLFVWPARDPFRDVVIENVERLRSERPLEQVARGDFNYRLRRSHFRG